MKKLLAWYLGITLGLTTSVIIIGDEVDGEFHDPERLVILFLTCLLWPFAILASVFVTLTSVIGLLCGVDEPNEFN